MNKETKILIFFVSIIVVCILLYNIVMNSFERNLYGQITSFGGTSAIVTVKEITISGSTQVGVASVQEYKTKLIDDTLYLELIGYEFPWGNPGGYALLDEAHCEQTHQLFI